MSKKIINRPFADLLSDLLIQKTIVEMVNHSPIQEDVPPELDQGTIDSVLAKYGLGSSSKKPLEKEELSEKAKANLPPLNGDYIISCTGKPVRLTVKRKKSLEK